MEEQKTQNAQKKLSYEELSKAASDLHVQYQKLLGEYRKAIDALNSRDFEYTSFYLQMLFKVTEKPELYRKEFVDWCVQQIEDAIMSFDESRKQEAVKDEAE